MKAVVYSKYGSPEVLKLIEIPRPQINANEVLIRVHASTVAAGDWRMRKAEPFPIRFVAGMFSPKFPVLGYEYAGTIEELGANVKNFKIGDEVFGTTGMTPGTHAEFVKVDASSMILKKPENISFEKAAATPVGALTAIYFLQEAGIKEGDMVLIHGASGAVGSAAVQIAKSMGTEVTAVSSGKNAYLMEQIGADLVIDYTKSDYSQSEKKYDVVFNAVGKTSYDQASKVLKKGAAYVASDAAPKDYLSMALQSFNKSHHRFHLGVSKPDINHFGKLHELLGNGGFSPVIDRFYSLEKTADAHAYVEQGHKVGNVVIQITKN